MDDPDFLAWQAAKRFERRASKIKEIQKMKILQKIVLKKMRRDENYLKKRKFIISILAVFVSLSISGMAIIDFNTI